MGFEPSAFVRQPVDQNLVCTLCLEVFNKPTTACSNGHVYCSECIQRSKRRADSCPDCRGDLLDPPPLNRPLQSLILGQAVRCKHYSPPAEEYEPPLTRRRSSREDGDAVGGNRNDRGSGCNWEGTLSDYLDTHEKSCDHNEVICPLGCKGHFLAREMEAHKAECEYRIVPCPLCKGQMKQCRLKRHQEKICYEALASCKFCKIEMKRKDLGRISKRSECHGDENHITGHYKECPKAKLRCEFHAEGCGAILAREDFAAHHAEKAQYHANLLAKAIKKVEKKIDDSKAWREKEINWEIPVGRLSSYSHVILESRNVSMFDQSIRLKLFASGPNILVRICASRNRIADLAIRNVRISTYGGEVGNEATVDIGSQCKFFLDREDDCDCICDGRFTYMVEQFGDDSDGEMVTLGRSALIAGANDGVITIISRFEMELPTSVVVGTL